MSAVILALTVVKLLAVVMPLAVVMRLAAVRLEVLDTTGGSTRV